MDNLIWVERLLNSLDTPNYTELLEETLSYVPNDIDKRQGSIVHMILASVCMKLEDVLMGSSQLYLQGNPMTATGVNLESIGETIGIFRKVATQSEGILVIEPSNVIVPNGSRFSTKFTENVVVFKVIQKINYQGKNAYRVRSEEVGYIGNDYIGELLPIDYIQNLTSSILVEVDKAGVEEETDNDLRERIVNKQSQQAFGGNIAYYRELIDSYDYIGGLQVYPVWNGGGTVKLVVVDSRQGLVSTTVLEGLKDEIDPINAEGNGIGKAPIGHKVTITTPTLFNITVTADITMAANSVKEIVEERITEEIAKYIRTVQDNWSIGNIYGNYTSTIYQAKILSAIISVPEVINATNIRVNGSSDDLNLIQNSNLQQFPKLISFKIN